MEKKKPRNLPKISLLLREYKTDYAQSYPQIVDNFVDILRIVQYGCDAWKIVRKENEF